MITPLIRPVLRRRRFLAEPVREIDLALRLGPMEARIARTAAEIDAVQALRYRVFFEEMAARPSPEAAARRRDIDMFDPYCDHLIVVDTRLGDGPESVVGTYRFLRRSVAAKVGRFYTQGEYNIRRLLQGHDEVMEVGRSCVDPAHRRHQTMQLMWRSIAYYVQHYNVTLMFGCASFPGTDPDAHALPLSYLAYNHLAPLTMRPKALRERYVEMRRMPREAVDEKAAVAELPPLIKGYLRLGGFVGDGAVVDPEFNTTDVSIIVKTDWLTGKYARHYYRDTANRDEGSSPEGARPEETPAGEAGAGGTRAGGRHSDGES
jgi:L-ornithine Nalpha-acyltransferase